MNTEAPHLSAREKQVLQALASGKRNKEIAFEMSLSIKSVSTYFTRIKEKTGTTNLFELGQFFGRLEGQDAVARYQVVREAAELGHKIDDRENAVAVFFPLPAGVDNDSDDDWPGIFDKAVDGARKA